MLKALQWFLEPDRPIGSDAELIHVFTKKAKEAVKNAHDHPAMKALDLTYELRKNGGKFYKVDSLAKKASDILA